MGWYVAFFLISFINSDMVLCCHMLLHVVLPHFRHTLCFVNFCSVTWSFEML
jgi:hypothetical protein